MSGAPPETENYDDDDAFFFRKRRKKHGDAIEGLNLTAMMDMMTIILVFLIKQYASASENVPLSAELQPPLSSIKTEIEATTSIFITKAEIMVDQKPAVELRNWQVVSADPKNALNPLNEALNKRAGQLELIEQRGGPPFDHRVMIVADKDVPYELLTTVMMASQRAKFYDYRMIVRLK